MFPQGRRLNIF
jgi:hypothetical protein